MKENNLVEILDNLSNTIVNRIKNNKEIDNSSIRLLEKICNVMISTNNNILPKSFYELRQIIKCMYSYDKINIISTPSIIFKLGAVWALVDTLYLKEQKEKIVHEIEELAKNYIDYYPIFLEMADYQGINIEELAEKTNIEINKVSDILIKLNNKGLFSYSKESNKTNIYDRYYISEKGLILLNKMHDIIEEKNVFVLIKERD